MILHVLIVMVASCLQRHQQQVITYLLAENRVLKAQLGGRRFRLIDTERRRLAALAHPLGRKRLKELATVATPDTLIRGRQTGQVRRRERLGGSCAITIVTQRDPALLFNHTGEVPKQYPQAQGTRPAATIAAPSLVNACGRSLRQLCFLAIKPDPSRSPPWQARAPGAGIRGRRLWSP